MYLPRRSVKFAIAAALSLSLFTSCVDAPGVPDETTFGTPLYVAPVFSLVDHTGSPARSQAQTDALDAAFAKVSRFHVVVKRSPSGESVVDTVIVVVPGQPEYDFSFGVTAGLDENFTVEITGYDGDNAEPLFVAAPITVKATPASAAGGGTPPTPTNVAMQYSGPDVDATSVQISPAQLVLAPGADGQFTAAVQGSDGSVIENVTLAWSPLADAGSVVAMDGGKATAGSVDGLTQVVVTTPTGLDARAWVYVVGGELAFTQRGTVRTRAAAGGDATDRGAGSAPAWSPDGRRLFHVSGGNVMSGSTTLVGGNWPSVSPDGSKLAVDAGGGQVVFINDDGTHPTPGPRGAMPVWNDGTSLLVAGGSVERVGYDGEGRSTVAAGAATAPARSADGSIAYVEDGALNVVGRGEAVATGVSGRPSFSANEMWLAVDIGGGLGIVPVAGGAPPVLLPGLEGAGDPAFNPEGSLSVIPGVVVSGFNPESPGPGEPVTVLGSGFDAIIPANNSVVWPIRGGTQTTETGAVTPTSIATVMPRAVIEGQVSVRVRNNSGVREFVPQLGAIEITALTPWEAPVAGVAVVVTTAADEATSVADGRTDDTGMLLLPGFVPGDYVVTITAPDGFELQGEAIHSVSLGASTQAIAVVVNPLIRSVTAVPEDLTVEVDGTLDVTLTAVDVNGDAVQRLATSRWVGSRPQLDASGTGFEGTITGLAPSSADGPAALLVEMNGTVFSFPVTVTSFIGGHVTKDPDPVTTDPATASTSQQTSGTSEQTSGSTGESGVQAVESETPLPAVGVTVVITTGRDEDPIRLQTDQDGNYRTDGLLAGEYTVAPEFTADLTPIPATQPVTLDANTPTGTANFHMSREPVYFISLDAGDGTIAALDGTLQVQFTAYNEDEQVLPGRRGTFVSSDPSIATVDPTSGVVTAVTNGTVIIAVTVEDAVNSISVEVDQVATEIVLIDDEEEAPFDPEKPLRGLIGETGTLLYEARDANEHLIDPNHKTPDWASSDALVASIDPAGEVSLLALGSTDLSATMDEVSDQISVDVFAVHTGDLIITNDSELLAAGLAQYGKISGSLIIDGSTLAHTNGLHTIWEVFGDVNVRDNTALTNILGLAGIEIVWGTLRIMRNDLLTTPAGPGGAALQHIGGDLEIWDNDLVTNADLFANLESVDGTIDVRNNTALQHLEGLVSLEYVGGIYLDHNEALASLNNFPALRHVGNNVEIEAGAAIFGIPLLEGIQGGLIAGGEVSVANTVLEHLSLPMLVCVGGGISIYDNDALHTVDLSGLRFLSYECGGDSPPGLLRALTVFSEDFRVDAESVVSVSRDRRVMEDPSSAEARRARVAEAVEAWDAEKRARRQEGDRAREALESAADLSRDRAKARRIQEGREALAQRMEARGYDGAQIQLALDLERETREATPARVERQRRPDEPKKTYYSDVSIYIYGNPALTTQNLQMLEWVEGGISFGESALTSIDLPALEWVEGDLDVDDADLVTTLSAPILDGVGDDLWLDDNDLLSVVNLPELDEVDDDMGIARNPSLTQFILPSLEYIGYDAYISDHPALTLLKLPVLSHVEYDLDIWGNGALDLVEIASGPETTLEVWGDFYIFDNSVREIRVPRLARVTDLDIWDNDDLELITVASEGLLQAYDIDMWENGGGGCQECVSPVEGVSTPSRPSAVPAGPGFDLVIPGLSELEGSIALWYNDDLRDVSIATATSLSIGDGGIEVWDNYGMTSFAAPGLTDIVDGDIDFWDHPALTSLSFPGVTHVGGDVEFGYNGTTGTSFVADFSALQTLTSDLDIYDNEGLQALAFPALSSIGDDLYVSYNDDLASLDFGPLGTVGSDFEVNSNSMLGSFTASSLTHAPDGVWVGNNDALTTFDLGALTNVDGDEPEEVEGLQAVGAPTPTVGSWVNIWSNEALTSFDLSSLTVVKEVQIGTNPSLATLPSLGSLESGASVELYNNATLADVNGLGAVMQLYKLEIRNNAALSNLSGLSGLAELTALTISGNAALTSISTMTSLGKVWDDFRISDNDAVTSLSFPAMTTVGAGVGPTEYDGYFIVADHLLLASMSFPSLATIDGPIAVRDNAVLANLNGLAGLTSPVWSVFVGRNALLSDISGLDEIGFTGLADPTVMQSFTISDNPVLDSCHIDDVVNAIEGYHVGSAFFLGTTITNNLVCET